MTLTTFLKGYMYIYIIHAGIHSARVALLAEKAEVQYDPDETSPEIIAEEINGLGFHAEYLADASSGDTSILDLKVWIKDCLRLSLYIDCTVPMLTCVSFVV